MPSSVVEEEKPKGKVLREIRVCAHRVQGIRAQRGPIRSPYKYYYIKILGVKICMIQPVAGR